MPKSTPCLKAGGVTTLTFEQRGLTAAAASDIGPGWEYYLDRLVAAETGGDVAAALKALRELGADVDVRFIGIGLPAAHHG